ERSKLSLSLGGLIAEGFFQAQTQDVRSLEKVGKAITQRATALGTGETLSSHSRALLERSKDADWDEFRQELAKTQRDVELELIRLRDVEAVNLISFGGWLRAMEVLCEVSANPFDPEKAALVQRLDILTYYAEEFAHLHPRTQEEKLIRNLRKELDDLQRLLKGIGSTPPSRRQFEQIRRVVARMADDAFE
ncbi:MAG: hypothetical protein AAGJ31_08355, partial [Verrucomicrobiota bacterium]